jgi:hypothetical protein
LSHSLSSGAAYNTRYDSLDCDPSTEDQQTQLPVASCSTLVEDDYSYFPYVGVEVYQAFCTVTSDSQLYPLPAGEWVVETQYTSNSCTGPAYYSAYKNGTCYATAAHYFNETLYSSFEYDFPPGISLYYNETGDCTGPHYTNTNMSCYDYGQLSDDNLGDDHYDANPNTNSEDYTLVTSTGYDTDSSSSSTTGLSGGAIAGIVIGVLTGVALLIFGVYYCVVISPKKSSAPLSRQENHLQVVDMTARNPV